MGEKWTGEDVEHVLDSVRAPLGRELDSLRAAARTVATFAQTNPWTGLADAPKEVKAAVDVLALALVS